MLSLALTWFESKPCSVSLAGKDNKTFNHSYSLKEPLPKKQHSLKIWTSFFICAIIIIFSQSCSVTHTVELLPLLPRISSTDTTPCIPGRWEGEWSLPSGWWSRNACSSCCPSAWGNKNISDRALRLKLETLTTKVSRTQCGTKNVRHPAFGCIPKPGLALRRLRSSSANKILVIHLPRHQVM